jgi:hypothetical protein
MSIAWLHLLLLVCGARSALSGEGGRGSRLARPAQPAPRAQGSADADSAGLAWRRGPGATPLPAAPPAAVRRMRPPRVLRACPLHRASYPSLPPPSPRAGAM